MIDEIYPYPDTLDEFEKILKEEKTLKKDLIGIDEITATLNTKGWKRIEKWLLQRISDMHRLSRTTNMVVGKDDKGKLIRRPATIEETGVWNIKIEARVEAVKRIFRELVSLRLKEKQIERRLKEIEEIKKEEM